MAGGRMLREDEASLATRAAWLHYTGGLTQSEVARRLGLSSLQAHRLIMKANHDGLVKVFIDGDVAECVELEHRLAGLHGLDYCEVVPECDGNPLPLRPLGRAGAQFLRREILHGAGALIGVGHGRTLAACVNYLPQMQAPKVRFVSLMGGFTRRFAANPHEVIHRLGEATGADAYVMPVPFYANSTADRDVLLNQNSIREVFELAATSDLFLVGIGTAEFDASMVASGLIEREEIAAIKAAGGVGEVLGHFFDRHGAVVETALSARTFTLSIEQLRGRRMVAVAGGRSKVAAVRAVLDSGLLQGLITDEATARGLLGGQTPAPRKASRARAAAAASPAKAEART